MKVLEKGRPQVGWSMELACTGDGNYGGGCGAKLLVEQADVYETQSSSYDGSSERRGDGPAEEDPASVPTAAPQRPGPRGAAPRATGRADDHRTG